MGNNKSSPPYKGGSFSCLPPLSCYISAEIPRNTLYYGDNLKILRDHIKDESVDLIYLDPPFNSNRNYNVLFKDESGAEAWLWSF